MGREEDDERSPEEEREEREQEEEREGRDQQLPPANKAQLDHDDAIAAFLAFVLTKEAVKPRRRVRAKKRSRLDWAPHASHAVSTKAFRRTYRMEERSFYKLVNILRPALKRNPKFAGECV